MKRIILSLLGLITFLSAQAQLPVMGTTYYLPKAGLRFSFLVEKTTYTPGQFAAYAGRYMKKSDVQLEPQTTYRIVSVSMSPYAVPDSAKQFTLNLDKKLSITEVDRSPEGLLLAINAKGGSVDVPKAFTPSPHPKTINPRDYMNEDILSAGSTAKMAELCAQDIYEIRDSRAQLSRGQADFMPKDGAQLKLMMENLDTQEKALMQTFEGTTLKDTTETVINFIPSKPTDHQLFFRFSKWLGFTDADDLAGSPYYISVVPENVINKDEITPEDDKKSKEDFGLYVNIPDKAKVTLYREGQEVKTYDVWAPQFGKVESLSSELFGRKQTSHLTLNPLTGSIVKIESETLK